MSNVPRDFALKSLRPVQPKRFTKKHLGQAKVAHETISDLPHDLAEEVFCRMKSLSSVRSTCKTWNTLTKDRSFATKHLGRQANLASAGEFMLVLMMDYKIHLVSVNLDNNVDLFMREEGTLIILDNSIQSEVFHCNGLLLCISEDNTRLVVWNPYWGQSECINHPHNFDRLECYIYDLGYDKSSNSHKILSFVDYKLLHHIDVDTPPTAVTFAEYKIFDFNSHSWRVLDVTLDWIIDDDRHVSINGNTYWFAKNKDSGRDEDSCLLCFDFTREVFGDPLPLPPNVWNTASTVALSSVREEQLAILFQPRGTLMEIWVTSKIEPNMVLWSTKVFLAVNITDFQFPITHASFFIDVDKEVAVVFGKDKRSLSSNLAYIVGVDGTLTKVHLGNSLYKYSFPRVCSYVPSLVQLN